jgi:2-dehydro-3-deoxyphosphogluconate aldolase/(4S)-4-hydroxy-2-oxoglutarate aldolase
MLRSLAGPLPGISFCPTGGVDPTNAESYLGLPNVVCVGGSWVAPSRMVQSGDWSGITGLARAASRLART